MKKQPCVYILTGQRNGTLYIGVTSDLRKRVWEHKNDLVEGFTRKYGLHRLVYYEIHCHYQGEAAQKVVPCVELKEATCNGVTCGKRSCEVLDARQRGHDGEQGWMDFTAVP